MSSRSTPRPVDAFLNSLEDQDKTLADWARERGFSYRSVYAVVAGHHVGRFGRARKIVKAMGIEPPRMRRDRAVSGDRA